MTRRTPVCSSLTVGSIGSDDNSTRVHSKLASQTKTPAAAGGWFDKIGFKFALASVGRCQVTISDGVGLGLAF